MIPEAPHGIDLAGPTVTDALAKDPSKTPKHASRKLFPKPFILKRAWLRFAIKDDLYKRPEPSEEELERAKKSGKWYDESTGQKGEQPSDLFLKIYADVLRCLDRDPLVGLVSPPLIGSCGTMPLSIISVIPDIMQHYYDCIVLAKREVLLATNYLQPSDSQRKICDGLKELSKRAGDRKQKEKIVVKLIYDRGNWKQLFKNHQAVLPKTSAWDDVKLPDPSEIPNLSIEVINFHRVLLGTFHAKYMIIDREMALLNSNNIQDRPNVEMMIHVEGPIVDSFYDMFLLSWSNALKPAPPFLSTKSPGHQPDSNPYLFDTDNPYLANIDVEEAARTARATLKQEAETDRKHAKARASSGQGFAAVVQQIMEDRDSRKRKSVDDTVKGNNPQASPGNRFAAVVQQMMMDDKGRKKSAGAQGQSADGGNLTKRHSDPPKPAAGSSAAKGNDTPASAPPANDGTGANNADRKSSSLPANTKINGDAKAQEGGDKKDASEGPGSQADGQAQQPKENGPKINGGKEERPQMSRQDTGKSVSDPEKDKRLRALSSALNAGTLLKASANVTDDHIIDDFKPHVFHAPHKPFPMAMVNRHPHGMPGHQDIRTPQNAAWMAGFRYAKERVFVQTPTLNASPVVRLCVETAKRGVEVVLYLDLGFNDKGESIPFQGGTNQEVVIKMYQQLKAVKKQKHLVVYWYTGKDQIRPINAVLKSRNCHVKFMAIDGHVGIQGNGNQDTQSWFHSQEINLLVDSKQIVDEWMHALVNNQNTEMFGRVHEDGIWRDSDGHTVDYYDKQAVEAKEAKEAEEKKGKQSSGQKSPADTAQQQAGGQVEKAAAGNGGGDTPEHQKKGIAKEGLSSTLLAAARAQKEKEGGGAAASEGTTAEKAATAGGEKAGAEEAKASSAEGNKPLSTEGAKPSPAETKPSTAEEANKPSTAQEGSRAADPAPAPEAKPAEGAAATGPAKSAEGAAPTQEAKPAEGPAPTEEAKPTQTAPTEATPGQQAP